MLLQMVQFIKQEAEEKANEIRVAAEEVGDETLTSTSPLRPRLPLSSSLSLLFFFFFS